MDLESCIKSSKEAFEKAEAELSKLHTSLTLVASLTGRPKRDVNDGSAWAAIERMDDRIDALDSDLGTTQMEVGGARDGLRRCETSVSKIGRKTERVTQYVRSFEQFGAVDKIRTLEGKVTTLSSQNAQLASDMHRLVGAVSSLMDRGLSGERPVGIDTLPNARLEALERSMAAQITEMKALVSGSGILRFGKWNLDGVASC
jgi:archaellum component FlaC